VRGEEEIGRDRRFDLVGGEAAEAGLRVLADMGVGPAIEPRLAARESNSRKAGCRLSPSRSCTNAQSSLVSG
jgi:hypothetical protein